MESYSATRQRIHEKSHKYFFFERLPKAKRNQFYGATDALFDTNINASDFSVGLLTHGAKILLCYGFLQALYVQQDAVRTLGGAFELPWKPDDDPELKRIRDVRNRLCGHPSRAGERGKDNQISSATISLHDISEDGFNGAVYFDNRFEKIQVDTIKLLKTNKERLLEQMIKIEAKMDEMEKEFRDERSEERFSTCFEGGFQHLVQRLNCDLSNVDTRVLADSCSDMIEEYIVKLQDRLRSRSFADLADSSIFRVIFRGIDFLQKLIRSSDHSNEDQDKFDLVYTGLQCYLDDLRNEIRELDEKLRTPV